MAFLAYRGCRVMAEEVPCPLNKWRLDVAGYVDRRPVDADESGGTLFDGLGVSGSAAARPRSERTPAFTVVIECKQARSDFLRDSDEIDALLRARERLETERRRLEVEWIQTLEPGLRGRGGDVLFEELEEWDYGSSRLASYRAVIAELDRIDVKLHGGTKFSAVARYRLADRLYVAAPAGMIRKRELPGGWGLLEFPESVLRKEVEGSGGVVSVAAVGGGGGVGGWMDLSRVREKVPAPALGAREDRRAALLRNIAAASTRSLFGEAVRAGMEQAAGYVASDVGVVVADAAEIVGDGAGGVGR